MILLLYTGQALQGHGYTLSLYFHHECLLPTGVFNLRPNERFLMRYFVWKEAIPTLRRCQWRREKSRQDERRSYGGSSLCQGIAISCGDKNENFISWVGKLRWNVLAFREEMNTWGNITWVFECYNTFWMCFILRNNFFRNEEYIMIGCSRLKPVCKWNILGPEYGILDELNRYQSTTIIIAFWL